MSAPHRGILPPLVMPYLDTQRDRQSPQPLAPLPLTTSLPLHSTQVSRPALPEPGRFSSNPFDASSQWIDAKRALDARADEDKRSQEVERTRQEELRLEQRRVEENMLREAIRAGIPPHLIPIIFAGIAGSSLGHVAMELTQHYLPHLQPQLRLLQTQQPPAPAPALAPPQRLSLPPPPPPSKHEPARDDTTQPQYYKAVPPQVHHLVQHLPPPAHQASAYPSPAYHSPTLRGHILNSANTSNPCPLPASTVPLASPRSTLPRLTTNEAKPTEPHHAVLPPTSNQQAQSTSHDVPNPSPSIYFHHWQPPADKPQDSTKPTSSSTVAASAPASNPSGTAKTSPHNPGSSGSERTSSPSQKRKAQGPHHPTPHHSAFDAAQAVSAYTHVLGKRDLSPAFSTASPISVATTRQRHNSADASRRTASNERSSGHARKDELGLANTSAPISVSMNPFAAASSLPATEGHPQTQASSGRAERRKRGRLPLEVHQQ